MYSKRIKNFIILSAFFLLVCLLRLIQMQLLPDSSLQDEITKLKLRRGRYTQLKTVRGRILDRKNRVLASEQLRFQLHINYELSSFADKRVIENKRLKAAGKYPPEIITVETEKELERGLENLQQIIEKCTYFGPEYITIEEKIKRINNSIWNLRTFLAWRRNNLNPDIIKKYDNKISNIPLSEAITDFEKQEPNERRRFLLVSKVDDIAEMNKTWPLLELKTDDDIFTAQLEFMNSDGIQIIPKAHRFYPYGPVAAQTIGWVGPATQEQDKRLLAKDRLSRYLSDEVCGREDGVEYIYETTLRGRRGEAVYDIDHKLIERTETQFGKEISITLDIELQKRIEDYLANCQFNAYCKTPTAAVVIDVATGDILAMASMPNFDLNRARYDYGILAQDPNEPLRNRAINKHYPPGSVIKPILLVVGLESGKITPEQIISCAAKKAPKGWPNCWIYNKYQICHDDKWQYSGGNNARNAIKGSCNIYFSQLANSINPEVLQQWLSAFGYGREIPFTSATYSSSPVDHSSNHKLRNLRQAHGIISVQNPELRYFGLGQGSLRVTPLQVANAFAAIARGGLYKLPRLFMDNTDNAKFEPVDLNISSETLAVIYDGMSAVINEFGGTAYDEFAHSNFAEQGIKVYGKTGSTQEPANAWFAGFAEDSKGRSIAIAVIVEGGQHGSSDAAPLARDIIGFCIEAEYIGQNNQIVR